MQVLRVAKLLTTLGESSYSDLSQGDTVVDVIENCYMSGYAGWGTLPWYGYEIWIIAGDIECIDSVPVLCVCRVGLCRRRGIVCVKQQSGTIQSVNC